MKIKTVPAMTYLPTDEEVAGAKRSIRNLIPNADRYEYVIESVFVRNDEISLAELLDVMACVAINRAARVHGYVMDELEMYAALALVYRPYRQLVEDGKLVEHMRVAGRYQMRSFVTLGGAR